MANRDLVAIGTSAGGVEALVFLARNFPEAMPASILITIHIGARSASAFADILMRAGPLPADTERVAFARVDLDEVAEAGRRTPLVTPRMDRRRDLYSVTYLGHEL